MKKYIFIVMGLLLVVAKPSFPQDKTKPDSSEQATTPKEEKSVTHHSIVIDKKNINYTAIAGTINIRDKNDSVTASIDYFAYIIDDVKDVSHRPISFAYNGGPGSSSIWLHMGALGPKVVVTTDADYTPPPPYKIIDNANSIIDKTDLVFIDPVGTGFSKAVGKKEDKDFWGVDADIQSVSQFIKQYVSDNNRWNSPKFLIGESYGTTRSAGIVDYLQTNEYMNFNGVILISTALDIESIFDLPGNERTFPLFLPTFTAVSWYHHLLPNQPKDLLPLLDEVRKFALGEYTVALMKGNMLSDSERNIIAEKLHNYTGLSTEYIKKSNLRIKESKYTQELLREHNEVIGRYDARFLGPVFDPLSEKAEYDPQEASMFSAFTAALLEYIHQDLKYGMGKTYHVFGDISDWKWEHREPIKGGEQLIANTAVDLANAMIYNPNLKVLVLQGYYDLATPFLATEYTISHLNMDKKFQSNISTKYYEAGHMMYLHKPAHEKMKSDMGEFIDECYQK